MFQRAAQICCCCLGNKFRGWLLIHQREDPRLESGTTTCFNHSSLAPRVHSMWLQHLHQTTSNLFPAPVYSNGLNGTISVYPLEGSMAGMMPTPTSASSPTAYTILDVDQHAYLFVGGILGTVKVSRRLFICASTSRTRMSFSLSSSCLLEGRRSQNINVHGLHGGDLLGR